MFPLLKALPLHPQRCFIKRVPRVRLTEAVTSEFIAHYESTTRRIPVPASSIMTEPSTFYGNLLMRRYYGLCSEASNEMIRKSA